MSYGMHAQLQPDMNTHTFARVGDTVRGLNPMCKWKILELVQRGYIINLIQDIEAGVTGHKQLLEFSRITDSECPWTNISHPEPY